MRYKIFFLFMPAVSLLSSCNPGPEKPEIKTKYSINRDRITDSAAKLDTLYITGGLTSTFIYDDSGQIKSIVASDGSKTVNVRTGNTVVSTQTDSTGKVISTETEFLNDKGQYDSSIVEKHGRITSTYKHFYDAQGRETEAREYTLGGMRNQLRLDFTWKLDYKDSNIVAETLRFAVMVDTIVMVNPKTLKLDTVIQRMDRPEVTNYYDYLADKLNTTHGFTNSRNLARRKVTVSGPNDTSQVNNMRYTFDEKGRVLTEVMESVPGYRDGASMQLEYDSSAYTYY